MSDSPTSEPNDDNNRRPAFTWLHVSDWHFKDASEKEYNKVLNDVVKQIGQTINTAVRSNQCHRIDCIIHTGDLAYSGKFDEYEEAQKALTQLISDLAINKERVIITPGNHDVINNVAFYPAELSHFSDDGEYVSAEHQWFGRRELLEILLKRFDGFHGFKRKYGYPNSCEEKDGYFIQHVRLSDYDIAIAAINSAVVSTRYDYEEKVGLLLGQRRVRTLTDELIKRYKDAKLRLLIFHHPFSYLNSRDALRCWEIIEDNFDVVLYGHKHSERDIMEHLTQVSGFPALDSGSIELTPKGSCWEVKAANFTVGQYYPPQSKNAQRFGEVRFIHFAVKKDGRGGFKFYVHHRPKEGHARPEKLDGPVVVLLAHPEHQPSLTPNPKPIHLIKGTTDLGCHESQSSAIVKNFYRQRDEGDDNFLFPKDKSLILPTKYFFWHVESRMLFHCMATHPDYWLRLESRKIFEAQQNKIVEKVIELAKEKHLSVVCLGIGEGRKEISLFRKIKDQRGCGGDTSLVFVDINYQMILRAARNMDLHEKEFAFVNTDFDSLTLDHIGSSPDQEETILFIMLGNTFANQFEGDFLERLSGLKAQGNDLFFLFDVPLKVNTKRKDKGAYASNEGREFSELTVRHFDKRYEKKWRLKDPNRIDAGKSLEDVHISDVPEAITVSNLVNSPTFGNLWLGMSHRYKLDKLKDFLANAGSGWEIEWDSNGNSSECWYALIGLNRKSS